MARERILIVDDEVELALSCRRLLAGKGYETAVAASGEEALVYVRELAPHLIITDLKMPGMSGMELVRQVKKDYPDIQAVMMTAFSTIEDAVEAMRLGAADFVPKPFTPGHLQVVVEKTLAERVLREENQNLKEQLEEQYSFDNIIGKSPAMGSIFEAIKKISNADINVLISGASGTGKELIARSIHAHSLRRGRPFVPINCGALPEQLVESEIFGHERGAFTGAAKSKPGLLEAAHEGTFLLDEIGEMPQDLQVKFLRVLQDGKFRRVGSNEEREVDIRLICATNKNLERLVEEGEFREDLYYRINTFSIDIPSLKKRPDDIPLLVDHFVARFAEKAQKQIGGVAPEAMKVLVQSEWKGNVRELEHAIERAVILAAESLIQPEDLPQNLQDAQSENKVAGIVHMDLPYKEAKVALLDDFERHYVVEMLGKYKGNISRSAKHSGIDRRSLHRLLAKHQINARAVADKV